MRICHRLNATIKALQELIDRSASFSGALGDGADRSKYILYAVIEFAHQQTLLFLGTHALRDIAGQAFDADIAAGRVELCLSGLFEPYLSSIRANETKARRIGRTLGAERLDLGDETFAISRMQPAKEVPPQSGTGRPRFQTENVGRVLAAP